MRAASLRSHRRPRPNLLVWPMKLALISLVAIPAACTDHRSPTAPTSRAAPLTSPATTVELLRRDAVVGVEADVTADRHIKRLGITCALCHSTVDNGVTLGVGRRLDGWPNRDLNVGAIVALSPALPAAVKTVF